MAGLPPVGKGKPVTIKDEGPEALPPTRSGGGNPATTPNLDGLPTGWNQQGFRTGFSAAKGEQSVQFKTLIFSRTQIILQKPGETSEQLHERLRERATSSMSAIRKPTRIITPSWLTVDVSKILGIENVVLISTSTCVHELPARIFVGVRRPGWHETLSDERHQYTLYDLGRELTPAEKNALYDAMRVGG